MSGLDEAVTVVVSRRVKPGAEAEFEALSVTMTQTASGFPGYLGATMLKPTSPLDPEYRIIFRFSNREQLERWNASEPRMELLNKIEPLISEQSRQESLEGIANWFSFPQTPTAPQPNKLRMTLVSWVALYPTVTVIFVLLADWLEPYPLPLRTLVITGIVMFLMSYVLMPRVTQWFRNWIFNAPEQR